MLKWFKILILLLTEAQIAYSDNSEVLRFNVNNDSASSSSLSFYFIGLGILLIGVISSEIFKLGFLPKILSSCRVDKLFLKAKIQSLNSQYDVYVRAMDDISVDFVSPRKFSKRSVINFNLLSLTGFKEYCPNTEGSNEGFCNLDGEVLFSKRIDKNACPTFLTRVKFPVITEQVQKPLIQYLQKLNASP